MKKRIFITLYVEVPAQAATRKISTHRLPTTRTQHCLARLGHIVYDLSQTNLIPFIFS